MIPAALVLAIFAAWDAPPPPPPHVRWYECRAFVRRMTTIPCVGDPMEDCPVATAPEPAACHVDGLTMLAPAPGPGEVIFGQVRACNGAGCSDWTGGAR